MFGSLGGCYLHHELAGEDDEAPPAAPTPVPAPRGHDAAEEPPVAVPDGGDRGWQLCRSECETCAPGWGHDVEVCMEGCFLRYSVAKENGCEPDFAGWIACVAEACEAERCRSFRSCW